MKQNQASIAFGIQPAKGTAATVSTHRLWLAGGSQVHSDVVKEDYEEMNGYATPLEAYIASVEGKGDPEFFCMPSSIAAILLAILGHDATTGSGDPYQHTETESDEIPYLTVWASTAGALYEKFVDVKLKAVKLHGESNKPLRVSPSFMGGVPSSAVAEETTAAIEKTNRFLYYDGLAALKIEGVAARLMRMFDLTIERNTAVVPGDAMTPNDSLVAALAVTLGITTTPSDFAEYNKIVYGSASPSDAAPPTSSPSTLGGSPAGFDLKFTRSSTRTLELLVPNVQRDPYSDQVSAAAGPMVRSQTFKAYKPSDGSTLMSAIVKNADVAVN